MTHDMKEKFSFCEPVTATSHSKWHLRKLTDKGKKLGGGADTPSLCGRKMGWDLDAPISKFILEDHICSECRKVFQKESRR